VPSAARTWTGPIDEARSPEVLDGHVVTPGPRPRLQGYDVEEDLAVHYGLVETFLLAMTGELPEPWQARAAEVALEFLAPAPVAEAPAHAAVVARICGARSSAILGIGAVTLAEQAHALVEENRDLLAWLAGGEGPPPAASLASTDEERESVVRLRAALAARDVELPVLAGDLSRDPALLAVLFHAGLCEPEHIEAVIVAARLPCLTAEALAWRPRALKEYPMNLPCFRYEE